MLSSSRSGLRLELLFWFTLVPRVYRAREGSVGTTLALTLESPPPARKASRTSTRRMFSAAVLTGERPREGSVANGTITGGDMPAGSGASSSFSVPADTTEKDRAGGGPGLGGRMSGGSIVLLMELIERVAGREHRERLRLPAARGDG
jgi:hypothetical protein